MARTQAEINSDLSIVNAALQRLISGEALSRLQLGSGEFSRVYEFGEITYENLKLEKADLTEELASVTNTEKLTLRQGYTIPLVVTKFPR